MPSRRCTPRNNSIPPTPVGMVAQRIAPCIDHASPRHLAGLYVICGVGISARLRIVMTTLGPIQKITCRGRSFEPKFAPALGTHKGRPNNSRIDTWPIGFGSPKKPYRSNRRDTWRWRRRARRTAFFLAMRRSSLLLTCHRLRRTVLKIPLLATCLRKRLSSWSCDSPGRSLTVGNLFTSLLQTQRPAEAGPHRRGHRFRWTAF